MTRRHSGLAADPFLVDGPPDVVVGGDQHGMGSVEASSPRLIARLAGANEERQAERKRDALDGFRHARGAPPAPVQNGGNGAANSDSTSPEAA